MAIETTQGSGYRVTDDHQIDIAQKYWRKKGLDATADRKVCILTTVSIKDPQRTVCQECNQTILRSPFIGVRFSRDHNQYTPLCFSCALRWGLVTTNPRKKDEDDDEDLILTDAGDSDDFEGIELADIRHREQPSGEQVFEINEEEDEEMALNLKGKLGGNKAATTAPAAPPPAAKAAAAPLTPPPAPVEDEGLVIEDDDDDDMELTTTTASPADLREKIETMDTKAKPGTLTRTDIHDIVTERLAAFKTDIDTMLKSQSTQLARNLSAVQADAREGIKTVMEHVQSVGVSLNELTAAITEALGGEASTEEEEAAPAAEPEKPKATPKATPKAAKDPKPAAAAAAPPAQRMEFPEFVAHYLTNGPQPIEELADAVVANGNISKVPDDRAKLIRGIGKILLREGFAVSEDGMVSKA